MMSSLRTVAFVSATTMSTLTSIMLHWKYIGIGEVKGTALVIACIWAYAAIVPPCATPLTVIALTNCAFNVYLGALCYSCRI